jgi:hypothetical protein
MTMRWTLVLTAAMALFLPAPLRAAEVAVMPVQGVNLSEGNSEAIGVLFANAFARDARVAVASPLQTKPLRVEGSTAAAVAGQLGATQYVELSAVRIGKRVKLGGALYSRDGAVLYRAEISAFNLDDMDVAIAKLAQSLVWRQPIAINPSADDGSVGQENVYETPPAAAEPPDPRASRGAYGPKAGMVIPRASGKTLSSGLFLQFDGRYGPRTHFFEFGAGVMIPTDDQYTGSLIRLTAGFLEFGASIYLWEGNTAVYLGGGLSPALWQLKVNYETHTAATCSAYGQLGVTFTRDWRARIYGEFRVSQILLGVANPLTDGTGYAYGLSDPYHPLMFGFHGGVGW